MRSNRRLALVVLVGAAAVLSGCGKARTVLGASGSNATVPLGDPTGGQGGASAQVDVTVCTACHGTPGFAPDGADPLVAAAPPVDAQGLSTSARVGAHRAHLVDGPYARAVECSSCHLIPQAVPHRAASVVFFSRRATVAWTGGHLTPTWNGTTCAGTYCHGNFKNGANVAPAWAAAGSVTCGSCHGVSTVNGPGGNHPSGVGTDCGSCHGAGYTSTTVNLATHMNGVLDLPNVSCSGCHGDGARAPVATATGVDVDGNPLVRAAPPQDVDGQFVSTAVGAHLAHVNQGDASGPGPLSSAFPCTTCHTVPTSKTHATGTANVTFGGLARAGGASPAPYDFGTATCSATYCHGAFTGGAGTNPVSWRGTTKLACTGCHGAPPATAATHHPPNPTCGTCHAGYTATTVAQATHVNGTVEHQPASGCTQCHGDVTASGVASTDPRAAPAYDPNAIDAHGNPATATAQAGVGAHAKHLTGTTFRSAPVSCGDCHAVPAAGDVSHANGAAEVPFGGLATSAWGGVTPSPTYGSNTCAGTYCHGNFKNGNHVTMTWASASPTPVACGSCHGVSPTNGPGGTHPDITSVSGNCGACHPGYTATSVNPALHINGQLDGGGEPSSGGTSCAGCHSPIFAGMDGTVVHTTAHHLASDVPNDDATSWGSPLSNVPAASRSCVNMCHGDHPHDLTSPVVTTHEYNVFADASTQATRGANSATRTTTNRASSDFTTGTGGMCLSCHKNPVSATLPAIPVSGFDAAAHDFVQFAVPGGATYTWQYQLHSGNFARDCTKCHASAAEGTTPAVAASGSGTVAVHFGDNVNLLAGKRSPGGTAAGFVCYNCHGSTANPPNGAQGNRSGKDIQAQIAKTSNHPSNADTRHDGNAEYTGATFGNALGVSAGTGQRHASCLDCHDTHEARSGTHAQGTNAAGPPLQGAWGVAFGGSLAAGSVPTAANFTKKTLAAGTDLEATLCFKCHSAYYGTLPTSPSGGYQETDQAREFNPANASFHPVLAAAPNPTPDILAPWTTTSLMTCTDCHESNTTTDPNGPHGSAAGFILKGPYTTWSTSVALQGSGGMPAGTFCANCHSSTFANSRFPAHTSGNHFGTPCWACHVRIPHGSGHRGLLVSVGTPVDGVKFTDSAPWAQSPQLGIGSYPTGNWSNNNCGCGQVSNGH